MENMRILITGGSGFIGTSLVEHFIELSRQFTNLDIRAPHKSSHQNYWQKSDILDTENVFLKFKAFQPTHVVHLAAKASIEGKSLEDYKENTVGTSNILSACTNTPSVSRIIITSTQHVRKPGSGLQANDADYDPLMMYGESKVVMEEIVRSRDIKCIWTIIRPTNIWGPWHPHLPYGLWRLMKKGLYFHPAGDQVIRSYGYVENAVWQIDQILNAPKELVDRKTYYIGELPSSQYDWVNQFSLGLTGRPVRLLPKELIRILAYTGDILKRMGISFPMYSSRYNNLITTNIVPVSPTFEVFGAPPYTTIDGIAKTVRWLETQNIF
jgi:nucleoside-diphosphate-sugar epimerase